MTISATAYFNHLLAYLNDEYVVSDGTDGRVILEEEYFPPEGTEPLKRIVELAVPSQGIGFKLDQSDFEASTKKRAKPALFHFLDDNAKPWSRRCDFVVFWRNGNALRADLIEFKSKGIQHDKIVPQLNAGLCWCRSLKHTIEHYTGYKKKIVARKFVFSSNQEPDAFLDANRQLNADVSVRFYHYDELAGMQIGDLQNQSEVMV